MENGITILGAGSWGITLANLLAKADHHVTLYSIEPEVIEDIQLFHQSKKYLPNITLSKKIRVVNSLKNIINENILCPHYIVFAVPAQQIRNVIIKLRQESLGSLPPIYKKGLFFVNAAKGLEQKTNKRMSEVARNELGRDIRFGCLYGPSFAEEVAKDMPTTVVAACEDLETAKAIQNIFTTPLFRVYTSTDLVGAELGASLKNVIAIGSGIIDGIGYGINTRVALIMRGKEEITRLSLELGANQKTLNGLTGIGDLFLTAMSPLSRNYQMGKLIGQGLPVKKALEKIKMVVEGYQTCPVVCELAEKHKIEIPITEQIYKVLYESKSPHKAIRELMTRNLKNEFE